MLRDEDVEAAVESGVITDAQADAMRKVALERRKPRAYALGREERFRLLGGFNDFFVAVGVVLLGLALSYGFTLGMPLSLEMRQLPKAADLFRHIAAWYTFALLVMWGLAELLTARTRLVAPSIVIVMFLATFAGIAGAMWTLVVQIGDRNLRTFSDLGDLELVISVGCTAAIAIVSLHYARFRLPFSLFVIAVCLVVLSHIAIYAALVGPLGLSPLAAGRQFKWISLALGLAIFAWAMSFDLADPERTSRRADCGFWLHLLAAPLIVHPLAGPLINHPLLGGSIAAGPSVNATTVSMVFALIAVLSLVALVIDRRALLVAGLGYLGAAIAYAMGSLGGSGLPSGLTTLALLGISIIVLGVRWRGIRAALMHVLPDLALKRRLPPYAAA